ncbi:PQQ-binding-like beta-propeller repeat protein [Actinoplanes philippinensis]|uniref:outer membrane protein assembly factor BamB family protein n=1 Tax=Actinoplanes philippinensis TaxID=35752 RepID=UPI0033F8B69F
MSVIDLGDINHLPDEPKGYPGRRRWPVRFRMSRLAKVATAVLAVLALGGSALPGRPVLREVWSTPVSDTESWSVEQDTVFVQGTELTAYELATGEVRWTRPVETGPSRVNVIARDGVLLLPGTEQSIDVTSGDVSAIGDAYSGSLTALDPASGMRLWERPGSVSSEDTGDTLLMYERDPTATMTWLRLVRVRDGSVVWERRAPEKADTVVVQFDGGAPARVVTATRLGGLTVLRYADGAPLASGSVPWRTRSYATRSGSSLSAVDGRLVVVDLVLETSGDLSRVAVYRAGDLGLLWSREVPGYATLQDCGPLLCLTKNGEGFVEAVDPDTGEKRWEKPGFQLIGSAPGGERLLVTGIDDKPTQTLVDTVTGRTIASDGSGILLSVDEQEGAALLLRGVDPATSVLSRLDTTTGKSTLLGRMSTGDLLCSGEDRWIACSAGGRLLVSTVG